MKGQVLQMNSSNLDAIVTFFQAAGGAVLLVNREWQPLDPGRFAVGARTLGFEINSDLIAQLKASISLDKTNLRKIIQINLNNKSDMETSLNGMVLSVDGEKQIKFLILLLSSQGSDAEEFLRNIIAVSNHEMRTPLMVISSGAQLLAGEVKLLKNSVELGELISMIQGGVDRLLTTFSKVLEFGKLLTPYPVSEMVRIDLNQLVQSCVDHQKNNQQHETWQISIPDQPVYILGDPNSLEQAINAILENAVTYSSAEQLIHILLYADQLNAQCFLKISDEGSGMDEKQKQQIFDAYHFGEDIMYKHTPGLGLGLTIAKKILSLHSGRILVDSKPGSGTSVTIKLPIQAHNN